ncbi:hypothetical protein ACFL0X_01715 [Nanoarchaeota archaeon]
MRGYITKPPYTEISICPPYSNRIFRVNIEPDESTLEAPAKIFYLPTRFENREIRSLKLSELTKLELKSLSITTGIPIKDLAKLRGIEKRVRMNHDSVEKA